jgi:hypothetical protein
VQAAERSDPAAQAIIAEFCQLINFPYQQQQGLFAVGFYNSVLPTRPEAAEAAPAHEPVAMETPVDDVEAPEMGAGMDAPAVTGERDSPQSVDSETPAQDIADPEPVAGTTEESEAAGGDPTPEPAALEEARLEEVRQQRQDEDELAALLDGHLNPPRNGQPEGLDAIDLEDVHIPDEPSSDARRSPDHVTQ